jgi:hypothetical protein
MAVIKTDVSPKVKVATRATGRVAGGLSLEYTDTVTTPVEFAEDKKADPRARSQLPPWTIR